MKFLDEYRDHPIARALAADGNLNDFDHMVAESKKHQVRIIVDFVPNHTSDQHPWYLDSKSSRNAPHRDWYIWRDGKASGQPPVLSLYKRVLALRHTNEALLEGSYIALNQDEANVMSYLRSYKGKAVLVA